MELSRAILFYIPILCLSITLDILTSVSIYLSFIEMLFLRMYFLLDDDIMVLRRLATFN